MIDPYRITSTHNPQDFFNGSEPSELSRQYTTDTLKESVDTELDCVYTVIVTKAGDGGD